MLTSSTLFIGDDNGTIENLGDSEKDRACAWLDNTIGNNSVVSERKEKINLGGILFPVAEATNSLLTISS